MLAQEIITVQLTPAQYNIFVSAMASAKQRDLNIREWTGETVEQIEARYQVPADEILEDMADAFFAQTSGIPMF